MTIDERLKKVEQQLIDLRTSVRTRGLVIENEQGKLVAGLWLNADGAQLVLGDRTGKATKVLLYATADSAVIALGGGDKGQSQLTLCTSAEGPVLTLYGPAGVARASLSLDGDVAALMLADKNGQNRAGLGVAESGPALELFDDKNHRAGLSIDENGQPKLTLVKTEEPPA
ncbi:MAG: hypothetical protein NTU94_08900 [Planctomycetota bacterium]|nr:hypothetical protein [Planctomycetota bacterium]